MISEIAKVGLNSKTLFCKIGIELFALHVEIDFPGHLLVIDLDEKGTGQSEQERLVGK